MGFLNAPGGVWAEKTCNCTRRSGSRTGRDRSSRLSTRLKSAVLAPMPSASVSVTTAGEHRAPPQHPDGILRVLYERIDQRQATCVAVLLAKRFGPAEFQKRLASRVRFGQTAPAGLIGQQLEVRRQLIVEVSIEPVSADERPQA